MIHGVRRNRSSPFQQIAAGGQAVEKARHVAIGERARRVSLRR